MARSGGGGDVFMTKNSKLEVFLKKVLPERTFERIRGYESCIVNKAFKYVILGDEWIYLTENPAKTIQESVWLGDIVSVDLVNDFPEFLSGEERENSQHLAVRFLTSTSQRRSFRKSRRPTDGSVHEADRSNASTPRESLSEDFGYLTQSMSSLHAGGSRPSSENSMREKIILSKKSKKAVLSGGSGEEVVGKSRRGVIDEERLEDIEECDLFERSQDSSIARRKLDALNTDKRTESGRKLSENGTAKNSLENATPEAPAVVTTQPQLESQAHKHDKWASKDSTGKPPGCCVHVCCLSRPNSAPQAILSSSSIHRAKRNSIGPVAADELNLNLNKEGFTNRDDVSEIIEVPNVKAPRSPRLSLDTSCHETVTPRLTPLSSSRLSTPLLRSRNTTPLGDQFHDGKSLLMVPNTSLMSGDTPSLSRDRRVTVLDIYLLTLSSPMLMLIRSAWNNFLIRSTQMLDPEFERTVKCGAVRSTYNQVEKMDILFVQLKRELFRLGNSVEDIYDLSHELKLAAERNFTLKKIFWKNSDMFPYLVRLIQSYHPTSRTNLNTVHGRRQRHEEIELVILLTEMISLMFRETELIPARFQTLKSQRGKAVLDLLRVLTCHPEIPEKQEVPSGRAAQLIQSFQDEGYSSTKSDEVARLETEFTDACVTTVFELFLMAKQANWNHNSDNFLNISWMVQVLEELSTTEKYVERVIEQTMALISPSRVEQLTPSEAIKLYQQFSVILTFLSHSPRVTFFIQNNYMEEFKYFVQPAAIGKKLSNNYPITRDTTRVIEEVLCKVLNLPGRSLSVSPS